MNGLGLDVVEGLFVVGGDEIAERGVKPLTALEHLDVLEYGPAGLGSGGPRLAVDQLVFQGRKPALGRRVIPTLTWPREALEDAVRLQELGELTRGV